MAEPLRFDIFAIDRASHVFDKVGEHSEKLGDKLGRVGKVAAIGLSGIATGVGAVAVAMGFGLKQASDYQKITTQTAAVLHSTGEAAGVSAEHVKALAEQISGYSGQSREAVQGGENLLLTFTNIKNRVGAGNKIFDQATAALSDMTAALGEDPKQAAIQLGKALNDPVKGITALRRVGVSFTAQQIEQVKHMVATGHTMQAQKLILRELNTEFGESAAKAGNTFSGSMEKLKNSLMDVVVDGLTPLLPKLTEAATWLAAKLPGAIKTVSGWFETLKGKFTEAGGAGDQISNTVKRLYGWFSQQLLPALESAAREIFPQLKSATKDLGEAIKKLQPTFAEIGLVLTTAVIPVLAKAAQITLTVLGPAFKVIATVINAVAIPAIKLIVESWLTFVGIMLDTAAKAFGWVPGIGGKLKKAASDFDKFRDQVNNSLNGIQRGVVISFTAQTDSLIRAAMKVGGQQGAALAKSAHGITRNASGTPWSAGGPTLVNEGGPEIIDMPRGAAVHTASASSRMLGGGDVYNITVVHHGISTPADDLRLANKLVQVLQVKNRAHGALQIQVAR